MLIVFLWDTLIMFGRKKMKGDYNRPEPELDAKLVTGTKSPAIS